MPPQVDSAQDSTAAEQTSNNPTTTTNNEAPAPPSSAAGAPNGAAASEGKSHRRVKSAREKATVELDKAKDKTQADPDAPLLNAAPGDTTVEVKKQPSGEEKEALLPLSERHGPFSMFFFNFLSGIVSKAHQKYLMITDLEPLGDADRSGKIIAKFDRIWEEQRRAAKLPEPREGNGAYAMMHLFFSLQPGTWMFSIFLECLARGSLFLTPFILDFIIRFLEGKDEQGTWYGIVLSLCLGGCLIFSGLCENRMQALLVKVTFNMQASIMGSVYHKYFRLSPDSIAATGTGKILNMIGEDTQRIFQLMPIIHFLWSAPLQILVVIVLLLLLVGWAPTLAAAGVLLVVVISMYYSNEAMQKLEKKRAGKMDERVKLISEAVKGMKAVKLYAWEEPMCESIDKVRKVELLRILQIYLLRAINVALFNMAPVMVSLVIFIVFVEQGGELDPALVFGAIALVNLLRAPLILLPMLQTAYNSSKVSFNRIYDFLCLPEREPDLYEGEAFGDSAIVVKGSYEWPGKDVHSGKAAPMANDVKSRMMSRQSSLISVSRAKSKISLIKTSKKTSNKALLETKSGQTTAKNSILALNSMGGPSPTAKSPRNTKDFRLTIDLKVAPGQLVQVIGPVGCGKSSVFSAILGNLNDTMEAAGGRMRHINGDVAYVPQQPWVMNKKLKDNILFGKPFDQEKYDQVIWMCALEQDLKQLPKGDQTVIGEQGINLSGGQKQRVALARAVYSDADIYLLDDPLSAVDQHVAAHIFFCCINHHLKDKAIVLATHQVQFLKYSDRIVVLEDGAQVASNKYEAIRYTHLKEYPQIERKNWIAKGHSVEFKKKEEEAKEAEGKAGAGGPPGKGGPPGGMPPGFKFKAQTGLPWSVHCSYFRSAGPYWVIALLLIFFIVTQLAIMATEWWMAAWTGNFFNRSNTFYIAIYGALGAGCFIIIFGRIFVYAFVARDASRNIHNDSLDTMMDGTMRYFDQTPMGSITSLFSRDQSMIDTFLPELYNVNVTLLTMLVVSLLIVAIVIPWFFLVFIPILLIAFLIQRHALPSVSNIQVLNLMSLGPVFSFFQESISGHAVIRASNKIQTSINAVEGKIDVLNNAYYHSQLVAKWLDIRMDFLSGTSVALAAVIIVLTRNNYRVEISSLMLTYTLASGTILGFIVQIRAYMEMMLTAVQRCKAFHKNTPKERFNGNVQIGKDWPDTPAIKFEKASFRYGDKSDENTPLVLKNLDITIPPSKKVAIIGRTGAGKSSLTQALLRVNELAEGRILIGGDPCHDIPLRSLRGHIAIIPQDPVLFTGTVRFNLDPFNKSTDKEVWEALEAVQLKEFIKNQAEGKQLSAPVHENGSNFSIGQRQLFCVARALLKRSKILIMDEATASVDYATDAKIQGVLRDKFSYCTVLTIAHRIQTILDYDIVLSLEKGEVVEFDNPNELLKDPKSYFSQLLTEEQKNSKKKAAENDEDMKTREA
eukprot:CAMPEP_0197538404 /NCGR_PEP_ID=MMETSP1318-20131121/59626_1 /TAXON_ID=552666 /ORGANISM="Partenskyella glossopodia, Strain RCC365" /LENGTH=1460 /DNA_ID=CAMNT_0043096805 /DNA_START=205 /DNA_END=4587 /DNA_ORIENTATION=+